MMRTYTYYEMRVASISRVQTFVPVEFRILLTLGVGGVGGCTRYHAWP